MAKVPGKLVKLLVRENETVKAGQPLAYIESTANHDEVIGLSGNLKDLQKLVLLDKPIVNAFFSKADKTQLGELQASYQTFFQAYLTYRSSVQNGFSVQKRAYLQKDLLDLDKQEAQLHAEKQIQQRDFSIAEDEYRMHQKLAQEKVETSAELRQQESKYLAKKSPLIQIEASLVTASTNYSAKQKEILELDNQIVEEKSKFLQALNSLISQADDWESKYVLTASQFDKLAYAGIVQENQVLTPNQEVFYVNPGNEDFFGEMAIPQNNMGRVKVGQVVLIKLKSYPFEEYGMLKGEIKYIADIPYKDSVFISKVDFKVRKISDMKRPIHLKHGMMANAEIVTQDATILQRIGHNISKIINNK
ncbi:MAG: HlyD family efflux transporter periplasmic adaptor subunit [Mucilaginibacter sp.]|nr:HlyD family efflux transporter periplasmic adaptor subunit [Mucilaginibacter sp.]